MPPWMLTTFPVKPSPSSRRTRNSSVSRCSVKMMSFSSLKRWSRRISRSFSNLDSSLVSYTRRAISRRLCTCSRSACSSARETAMTPPEPDPRDFVLLVAILDFFFIGRHLIEHVMEAFEPALEGNQPFMCEPPSLDIVDKPIQFLRTTLDGSHHGIGGAGQPPLKDAHRQPGSRAV